MAVSGGEGTIVSSELSLQQGKGHQYQSRYGINRRSRSQDQGSPSGMKEGWRRGLQAALVLKSAGPDTELGIVKACYHELGTHPGTAPCRDHTTGRWRWSWPASWLLLWPS